MSEAALPSDDTPTAGERVVLPAVPGEFGELGRALETMRARLDGKQYVEHYVHTLAHELKAPLAAIRGSAAADRVLAEAHPERAKIAVLAIPQALEAGEVVARLRGLNAGMTILARAHSDGEVRHLLKHGADGAVLAEKELAHSMAEMALSAPPFRAHRPA